mgnify:CR=1 FL=1
MSDIRDLEKYLRGFAYQREWEGFHTPSNLAKSVSIEAAELLELFQWSDKPKKDPAPEMADILIYLIRMADAMGIDLVAAAWAKIAENNQKYPVEKCKGKSDKYNELD